MSDHVWVEENLDAFVTGGLSLQERSRVEKHIESCAECAHAKTEICEMEQLMDGIFTHVRPEAGLADRAIQRLRQARKPRPSWMRFVTAAAAVIVLGMIGGGVQIFALNGSLPLPGAPAPDFVAGDSSTRNASPFALFRFPSEENEVALKESSKGKSFENRSFIRERGAGVLIDESDSMKQKEAGYSSDGRKEPLLGLGKQMEDLGEPKKKSDQTPGKDLPATFYGGESSGKDAGKLSAERGFYDKESKQDKGEKMDLAKITNADKEIGLHIIRGIDPALVEEAKKAILGGGKSPLASSTAPPGWGLMYKNHGYQIPTPGGVPPAGFSGGMMGMGGGFGMIGAGSTPSGGNDWFAAPAGPSNGSTTPPGFGIWNAASMLPPGGVATSNIGGPPKGTAPTMPPPPRSTYLPMVPPPVQLANKEGGDKKGDPASSKGEEGRGKGDTKPGDGKTGRDMTPASEQPGQQKPEPKVAPPQDTGRKIIRTGEMEFETTSFDKAVDSINQLIFGVKGGFIATVNSDKLANGKMRGSVVVRMPPEHLDKFIFDLRREVTKSGELKNQRIGSQDVTKQYTDIESRLRAARAIEERLIAIIKTGKGEIKDLVAAERELGIWRTKIEEMEGEIRYYSNQVALSTLTISLYEKEIQAPTAIVVTETVQIRLEVDEVAKAHQIAMKVVEELKGRITRSELKQHTAGQFLSILHAEIPPAKKDAFIDQLKKLGIVSDFQENQRQHTEGGTGKAPELKPKQSDVCFEVTMNNTANIRPRLSADLKVATTDVPAAYTKLLDAIAKAKGQVRDGKLNEQDKLNIHAQLDFNVPTSEKPALDKLLESIGPVLERINVRAPVSELSTASKFGYTLLLRDFASIPPREVLVEIVATIDVQGSYAKLQDAVAKAKGQIADAKLNEQDKLNITAQLAFTVPSEEQKAMEKLLESIGTVLSRSNAQTPVNQLATSKKFGFSILLRDFASIPPSKATALAVATNDVPASYAKLLDAITKAKGQLVDAKLNEQEKFNITAQVDFSVPTEQKSAIDKLLVDIGSILSRNNVQASVNQLSIAKKFGYSITLRDFANILPTHAADVTIAAADVPGSYAKLVDAVVKAKGQISKAVLNEQDKLNVSAALNFTVPTTEKPAFDKLLADFGTMLSRNNVQAPLNSLTTDGKFGYSLALRDFANIPPRETFHLHIAAIDVPAAFRELQEAVAAAKGLVTVGQLTEDNKVKMEANFNFDVPAAERPGLEKLFSKLGAVLSRTSSQVPVNNLATDVKVGYKLTLRSTASIPPRETVSVKMEVNDVETRVAELRESINAGKGRVIDANVERHENGQVIGVMTLEVPFASQDAILRQIKGDRKFASQKAVRNPQAPENELTKSHIVLTLAGTSPIVPSDEGLGSYVRASLYMSFRVFSVCLMLIILGVSAVLPWVLVIWIVYKVYSRMTGGRDVQLAVEGGPTPPSAESPRT